MNSLRRAIKCVAILARDGRIPKPLRGAAAVGLLPLPGPLDEAILLIVALPLLVFYRQSMRDAWQQALASTPIGDEQPRCSVKPETARRSRLEG